jgi:RimJ/RimL family protein N-acetyltransferase
MELVRLKSGKEVLIRPIRSDDGPRLKLAYDRLSPESRYRRFLVAKPHLSSSEVRYLVEIDGQRHVALVATSPDDAGNILAVGRFVSLPEDPGAAEFAIVVADHLQGQGLATALLERLADEALRRGIRRFRATMLADNEPVHRLIRRLARRQPVTLQRGPIDEVEIELAA